MNLTDFPVSLLLVQPADHICNRHKIIKVCDFFCRGKAHGLKDRAAGPIGAVVSSGMLLQLGARNYIFGQIVNLTKTFAASDGNAAGAP